VRTKSTSYGHPTISLEQDIDDLLRDSLPYLSDNGDSKALDAYLNSKDYSKLLEGLVDVVKKHTGAVTE